MLETVLLTLSASPIALPAPASSPLSPRLQKVTHNRIMMTSSFLLTPPRHPGVATKSYLFRHVHASEFNFEHVVAVCLLFYEAMLEVAPKSGPESK